jgi:hypothetical protein
VFFIVGGRILLFAVAGASCEQEQTYTAVFSFATVWRLLFFRKITGNRKAKKITGKHLGNLSFTGVVNELGT